MPCEKNRETYSYVIGTNTEEIKKDNLLEENSKKLKEMIENNFSYKEISNQSKNIDNLVLQKLNISIKKDN